MGDDKGLVKKIFWTQDIINIEELTHLKRIMLDSCQKLEEKGYGLLADKTNPEKIDNNYLIVSPDGKVFAHEQIENYWAERGGAFNSENIKDLEMFHLNIYYTGFSDLKKDNLLFGK